MTSSNPMNIPHTRTATSRDDWRTPAWVRSAFLQHCAASRSGVPLRTIDPCASVHPGDHWCDDNSRDLATLPPLGPNDAIWINPPYGTSLRKLADAIDSWLRSHAALVVVLVPARPGSRWWDTLATPGREIIIPHKRLAFELPHAEYSPATIGAPFPSAMICDGSSLGVRNKWVRAWAGAAWTCTATSQPRGRATLPPVLPVDDIANSIGRNTTLVNDPTRLLILDSGAFSVWTRGVTIDLEEYISFCEQHSECSYYVNLDVIPGKPGDKSSLTKEAVEDSCKRGWDNWKMMIERLPKDKVIPVFHQGDDVKWLDKYLLAGVKYIGISPANDRATGDRQKEKFRDTRPGFRPHFGSLQNIIDPRPLKGSLRKVVRATTKIEWIQSLRPFLFSGDTPTVRTHGFAVTSYDLMKAMKWYSVDSASWKLAGAWGGIYVPRGLNSWDFTIEPQIRASGNQRDAMDGRSRNQKPFAPRVLKWLEECDVKVGAFKLNQESESYKLKRADGEIWHNKEKRVVLVPIEKGVTTHVEERLRVNAEFIKRANKALKEHVTHIYFAGAMMSYELEFNLRKRLLSFQHTKGEWGSKCLRQHERHVHQFRMSK